MKQIFTLILGDLGLFLLCSATTIISWFAFPAFVGACNGSIIFKLAGYILLCPLAICCYASSLLMSIMLILRGIKSKKWWWLCLGLLLFVFNIVILVKSLI